MQQKSYSRDGFLVLEDFCSADQCRELMARAAGLVAAFDMDAHRSVFSTRDQARTSDDYFLGSGDKVRFFFEEDALDREGRLTVPREQAINKIGHALHRRDPVFSAFSSDARLIEACEALGMSRPLAIQSMYIYKQPRIGGEVRLHQDATFLYTDPVTVTGFWLALEDARIDNGCLYALPGGHRDGLKQRFVRTAEDTTQFKTLDARPFRDVQPLPLEVPAGTLIVLHGLLPHFSGPNRSAASRQAYSLHFIDAQAHYPRDNWLQTSEVSG